MHLERASVGKCFEEGLGRHAFFWNLFLEVAFALWLSNDTLSSTIGDVDGQATQPFERKAKGKPS